MLFSVSMLSLAFVATMASASSIDNTQMQAVVLASQAKVSGSYTFRNVQTGKYLQFTRNSGKANVYTQSSKKSVSLKWTRVSGSSGKSKGSWQGVSIADGSSNGKCLAAQYGKQNGQGKDIAAVAYACRTSGESVAKQVWALVPCGTSSSAITFSKKVSRRRRSLDLEDRANNAAITEPVVVDEDEDEDENDVEESPLFTDEDVAEYTETDDDADFNLGKRGSSSTYCILTHDHLFDQRARAVGSKAVKSAGGFTSQGMVDFNAKDKSQWWAVVSSRSHGLVVKPGIARAPSWRK
ncbi:BZ3500_MvSof-1268-A1-R1_Chr4-1g06664 [Microbotryum saponariae]|uniref:BZ3500_MvSof-1268-A1-R1_Chr4-1g06664 protein n=1 Tax=Microbotryum saponariae TaxID=289078 RepID=A0A2X0LKB7_9BASI|nr:BZ3500_MvSof-1268-A1-R1_Chr4-1g06664 [Microbotryum saponariae]SDA06329.1 BZ3501_MvSof-1269-A2-R1_Chr4-1g06374 [Microbotryum saponariae]